MFQSLFQFICIFNLLPITYYSLPIVTPSVFMSFSIMIDIKFKNNEKLSNSLSNFALKIKKKIA